MEQPLPNRISCLLIPMQECNLLLPNTSVAEIVDYQVPEKSPHTPDWFLGFVRWRGLKLPLISYENANGQESLDVAANARIAVTNTIGEHQPPLSFMAFVTRGIPRLMKITKEEIAQAENQSNGDADKMIVKVSGEEATIPELIHLEKLATQALAEF